MAIVFILDRARHAQRHGIMTRARRPNASPSERLAVELNRIGAHLASGYCAKARITLNELRKAMTGKQVQVGSYLRICAAIGFDPCPDLPHPMVEPGDFNALAFAMAFRIKRGLRGHDYEEAGVAMGLKPATVRRIEYGNPTSVSVMIKSAKYMQLHAFSWVIRPVSKNKGMSVPYPSPADVSRETMVTT
jgi:hypothetical protein